MPSTAPAGGKREDRVVEQQETEQAERRQARPSLGRAHLGRLLQLLQDRRVLESRHPA